MYKIEIHQSGILINFTTDISIRPFTRFQYSRFVIFFFFFNSKYSNLPFDAQINFCLHYIYKFYLINIILFFLYQKTNTIQFERDDTV